MCISLFVAEKYNSRLEAPWSSMWRKDQEAPSKCACASSFYSLSRLRVETVFFCRVCRCMARYMRPPNTSLFVRNISDESRWVLRGSGGLPVRSGFVKTSAGRVSLAVSGGLAAVGRVETTANFEPRVNEKS